MRPSAPGLLPAGRGVMLAIMADYHRLVHALADASGTLIARYFHAGNTAVEFKADDSPVTIADREGEAVMRELIHDTYPEHGIIGEEFGADRADAEFVWTLDPVDGTLSFARNCPLFGTLIGLLYRNKPILGAIHLPVLQKLCIGDSAGTFINGQQTRVGATGQLADATLLTTDLDDTRRHSPASFEALTAQSRLVRTWGDCYGYYQVAAGHADIMLDPYLETWDVTPLIPIIRGAGGAITTWDGAEPTGGSTCLAASKPLHGQALAILGGDSGA